MWLTRVHDLQNASFSFNPQQVYRIAVDSASQMAPPTPTGASKSMSVR